MPSKISTQQALSHIEGKIPGQADFNLGLDDGQREVLTSVAGQRLPPIQTVAPTTKTKESYPTPTPRGRRDNQVAEPRGPPVLWRLPKVLSVTAMGKSQLLVAVSEGRFPKPIRILEGGKAVAWIADEVINYIHARMAARDQGHSPAARS
jgi:predicted DNA-binding transcriptional regulator AlpA